MDTRAVVAFDLDRTLTTRDTLVPFLARAVGSRRTMTALALRSAQQLSRRQFQRDSMKAAVLADVLGGLEHARLAEIGKEHATQIDRAWTRLDVLERLRWHQARGHRIAIVSASLRYYVHPLATRWGVDDVLATELEVGDDGKATGALLGANCRGREKLRRLHDLYGDREPLEWAYGNSGGDAEMLGAARHAVLVGRERLAAEPSMASS